MIRVGSQQRLKDGGLGVSQFGLACGRQTADATIAFVRRWGDDRALRPDITDELCRLTCTALAPGIPLAGSVCVRLRWADLDNVQVDVEWHGLHRATPDEVADEVLEETAAVMDARAVRWGVDRGTTPAQWMIVDTRSTHDRPPSPPAD